MSNLQPHDERWQVCQPGTLAELACLDRRLQRRQFFKRVGSASGLIGMGIIGAWMLTNRSNDSLPVKQQFPGDKMYGGILCSKVKEQGQLFLDGMLDDSVISKIEIHLESCISCKDFIESLSKSENSADV